MNDKTRLKRIDDARLTLRVPQELYEQAKAKAEREDVTLSQVVRRFLREWVKDSQPTDTQRGKSQDKN